MLYDRHYMKFPSIKQGFSLNEKFILTLIIVFVVQKAFDLFSQTNYIEDIFALSVPSFSNGFIWSIVTYAFLHHGTASRCVLQFGVFNIKNPEVLIQLRKI